MNKLPLARFSWAETSPFVKIRATKTPHDLRQSNLNRDGKVPLALTRYHRTILWGHRYEGVPTNLACYSLWRQRIEHVRALDDSLSIPSHVEVNIKHIGHCTAEIETLLLSLVAQTQIAAEYTFLVHDPERSTWYVFSNQMRFT